MNPFALTYREQQQLFIFSRDYVSTTLLKVGGLSSLLSRFCVQFFWNPVAATSLTVLLLALSSYMLWIAVRRSKHDWITIFVSLVPSCFIGASISDNCLHFDFLTSIILAEAGLVAFKNLGFHKLISGIFLTIILYVTSGPVAIVFSCSGCIIGMFEEEYPCGKKWHYIALPLVAVACGALSYSLSQTPVLADSFLPSFHYDNDVSMPVAHWFGWISIIVVVLLSRINHKKIMAVSGLIIFVISLAFSIHISRNIDKGSNIIGYEYEYYTVNERWDDLIESCKRHVWSPGTANYLNLSNAYKGKLSENVLKYDNRGISSLLMIPEAKTVDVRVAHIMFAMGNVAGAQNISYNALFTSEGYAPSMLKMNTLIELMRGSYDIAEKYLSILEKTIHYREWSEQHRRFLWNDRAVGEDVLLGNGRINFYAANGFATPEKSFMDLMEIVRQNPSDTKAMQYCLSFLLLSKDISRLQKFVDEYWGWVSLKPLPAAVQEALIFYSEYSRNFPDVEPIGLDWCRSHGVTDETIRRFGRFQQATLSNGGRAPDSFRTTFWHYLLYEQI